MFQTDLTRAHVQESLAIPRLEACMPGSRAWVSTLSPFICDLWWRWPDQKPIGVEQKTDYKWTKTGNVAVEPKSIKVPYVLYHLHDSDYWCLYETETLLSLCDMSPHVLGGDFMADLALIPADDFITNAFLI